MTISETKNGKAKLFGRLAALSLAVWTLGSCDPEPVDTTPKAVLNLHAEPGVNKVDLSWELVDDENRTGIRVSYADKTADLVKDAKVYSAEQLAGGVAVKFSVRALGADGKMSAAAEEEGTPNRGPLSLQEKRDFFNTWVEDEDNRICNDGPYHDLVKDLPPFIKHGFIEGVKNRHDDTEFNTFDVYTTDELEAKIKESEASYAPNSYMSKTTPKNKFIANQNRMAKAVVKNSRVRGA